MGILFLIPLIVCICFYYRFIKKKEKILFTVIDTDEQQERIEKVFDKSFVFSAEILFGCYLVCLTSFVVYSILHFQSRDKFNVTSLVLFFMSSLFILASLIIFDHNPDPFKLFRFSFKISSQLALNHFLIQIGAQVLATVFLVLFNGMPYLPLIPLGLLLLLTAIGRPYKYPRDNIRSTFYQIVQCMSVILNVCLMYMPKKLYTSFLIPILILYSCLLCLVSIVGIVNILYTRFGKKANITSQEENEMVSKIKENLILQQLVQSNVKYKIVQMKENNYFKSLLNPQLSILNYSNYVKNSISPKEDDRLKQFEKIEQAQVPETDNSSNNKQKLRMIRSAVLS